MTAVMLTVVSLAVAYAIDAVLVGALLGASRLRSGRPRLGRGLFPLLFAVFASLDLYWIPAVAALDLQLHVGNPGAAAFFGETLPATELVGRGWFDIAAWGAQCLVAVWVADRISRRPEESRSPEREL